MHSVFELNVDQLDELVKDEYSLIKIVERELSVPLPPYKLDKVANTIYDLIKYEWTNRYSIDLQGILLYHDQLEFKSDYGRIKDDCPFVFWDISARFYIFCPSVGSIIRGKINKFTKTQVMNALVLNCIIAAFSPEKVHDSVSNQMELGKEILFRVESFDVDHSLIYGIIDEECVELMREKGIVGLQPIINVTKAIEFETTNQQDQQ
ncbi:uncharacterized protein LOC128385568 [Panonychus citri]|uniref:uncharacterized protein LOC128385568 n=1 Tax=Panonychus citri TaxID=50023 RepID=UPI002307B548|nr:uncharacterized protein LOC128385568 [Panonychus citri]